MSVFSCTMEYRKVLLLPLCCLIITVYDAMCSTNGMASRPFQGFPNILEVECSGEGLPPNKDLLSIALYDSEHNAVIASVNVAQDKCSTSGTFASCAVDRSNSRATLVKTLVLDLQFGSVRTYGCDVTTYQAGERPEFVSWSLAVEHPKTTTTTTTSTTTPATTTTTPQPLSKGPVASGVMGKLEEFQLPITVVIIGLVLLIFFAILCAILIILQCRGKKRRRARRDNRESLLSTKSEPVGGEYRTTRSTSSFPPPGHMAPETPGGNFAMRYQKSIPGIFNDTGYVSGSSVYYSEPYGTLDDEMKERLRPNPRLCHIPYDVKGGPLDTGSQEGSA